MAQALHATTSDTQPFPAGGGCWVVKCSKCDWSRARHYPANVDEDEALGRAHFFGNHHEMKHNKGTL